MMEPRDLILSLKTRLARHLSAGGAEDAIASFDLPAPQRLAVRTQAINAIFDIGRPAEPPSQARINALARLREGRVQITRKDWNLIAWGLCDACGRAGLPIEDDPLFNKIIAFVDEEARSGISRKIWFGLLHSYFAYTQERPEEYPNWLELRAKLKDTLPDLIKRQKRPKAWTRALERHRELLTDDAGSELSRALFNGDDALTKEVTTYMPVPANSWLWRRIISKQLAMLKNIGDERFMIALPALIGLATQHPQETDNILIALLTRYYHSSYQMQPHENLKQFALDHWQSPQVKSANRWSQVAPEVHQMMLSWFAKADLEHFFSLLQSEQGVDQARLEYWLRFVDQISYTRIVMGSDAYLNPDSDFNDFRSKNKGRFSRLIDNNSANNAFVMKLGPFYFVEFSVTGNACYIYSESNLPFAPENIHFHLSELKRKGSEVERILHNGDWWRRADRILAKLGIFATHGRPSTQQASRSVNSANNSDISDNEISGSKLPTPEELANSKGTERAVLFGHIVATRNGLSTRDHRSSGGAFWVVEDGSRIQVRLALQKVGYEFRAGKGYWIK